MKLNRKEERKLEKLLRHQIIKFLKRNRVNPKKTEKPKKKGDETEIEGKETEKGKANSSKENTVTTPVFYKISEKEID